MSLIADEFAKHEDPSLNTLIQDQVGPHARLCITVSRVSESMCTSSAENSDTRRHAASVGIAAPEAVRLDDMRSRRDYI
jgi:hypothetical protein